MLPAGAQPCAWPVQTPPARPPARSSSRRRRRPPCGQLQPSLLLPNLPFLQAPVSKKTPKRLTVMRPAPSRVLGSIRHMSTSVARPVDSLAATFGRVPKAVRREGGGISGSARPASASNKSYGLEDDGDVTQSGSAVADDAQAVKVLPIFKYHGNWGVPKTPVRPTLSFASFGRRCLS